MTYICTLIILKYEDVFTFKEIFKYLHNLPKFSPEIVHLDYSLSLRKGLLEEDIFSKKPILMHCFFYFIQPIIKKMKEYKIFKKNINKKKFCFN